MATSGGNSSKDGPALGELDLFELFAHEVRGPLGVIDGAAQTLDLPGDGPDDDHRIAR